MPFSVTGRLEVVELSDHGVVGVGSAVHGLELRLAGGILIVRDNFRPNQIIGDLRVAVFVQIQSGHHSILELHKAGGLALVGGRHSGGEGDGIALVDPLRCTGNGRSSVGLHGDVHMLAHHVDILMRVAIVNQLGHLGVVEGVGGNHLDAIDHMGVFRLHADLRGGGVGELRHADGAPGLAVVKALVPLDGDVRAVVLGKFQLLAALGVDVIQLQDIVALRLDVFAVGDFGADGNRLAVIGHGGIVDGDGHVVISLGIGIAGGVGVNGVGEVGYILIARVADLHGPELEGQLCIGGRGFAILHRGSLVRRVEVVAAVGVADAIDVEGQDGAVEGVGGDCHEVVLGHILLRQVNGLAQRSPSAVRRPIVEGHSAGGQGVGGLVALNGGGEGHLVAIVGTGSGGDVGVDVSGGGLEGVAGIQIQDGLSGGADDGLLGHGAGLHMTHGHGFQAVLLVQGGGFLLIGNLGCSLNGLHNAGFYAALIHGLLLAVPLDGVVRAVGEPAAVSAGDGEAQVLAAGLIHEREGHGGGSGQVVGVSIGADVLGYRTFRTFVNHAEARRCDGGGADVDGLEISNGATLVEDAGALVNRVVLIAVVGDGLAVDPVGGHNVLELGHAVGVDLDADLVEEDVIGAVHIAIEEDVAVVDLAVRIGDGGGQGDGLALILAVVLADGREGLVVALGHSDFHGAGLDHGVGDDQLGGGGSQHGVIGGIGGEGLGCSQYTKGLIHGEGIVAHGGDDSAVAVVLLTLVADNDAGVCGVSSQGSPLSGGIAHGTELPGNLVVLVHHELRAIARAGGVIDVARVNLGQSQGVGLVGDHGGHFIVLVIGDDNGLIHGIVPGDSRGLEVHEALTHVELRTGEVVVARIGGLEVHLVAETVGGIIAVGRQGHLKGGIAVLIHIGNLGANHCGVRATFMTPHHLQLDIAPGTRLVVLDAGDIDGHIDLGVLEAVGLVGNFHTGLVGQSDFNGSSLGVNAKALGVHAVFRAGPAAGGHGLGCETVHGLVGVEDNLQLAEAVGIGDIRPGLAAVGGLLPDVSEVGVVALGLLGVHQSNDGRELSGVDGGVGALEDVGFLHNRLVNDITVLVIDLEAIVHHLDGVGQEGDIAVGLLRLAGLEDLAAIVDGVDDAAGGGRLRRLPGVGGLAGLLVDLGLADHSGLCAIETVVEGHGAGGLAAVGSHGGGEHHVTAGGIYRHYIIRAVGAGGVVVADLQRGLGLSQHGIGGGVGGEHLGLGELAEGHVHGQAVVALGGHHSAIAVLLRAILRSHIEAGLGSAIDILPTSGSGGADLLALPLDGVVLAEGELRAHANAMVANGHVAGIDVGEHQGVGLVGLHTGDRFGSGIRARIDDHVLGKGTILICPGDGSGLELNIVGSGAAADAVSKGVVTGEGGYEVDLVAVDSIVAVSRQLHGE